MILRSLHQLTDDVRQLRLERGVGAHLPESLREAVAHLAASDGIRSVSRSLDVSRNTIRLWMKRYPATPCTQAANQMRSRTSVPDGMRVAPLSTVAVPAPIAFFEIKTSASLATDHRPPFATSSVELTRPDGWVVRASGDVAKDLAPMMLGQFFTTIPGEMT